ncbi:MAG: SDR family oxidoreductase [Bryobacteraceae bacterium]|nr:SDR family oxidoreductase [Bryobacteraceae bacterium]
MSALHPDLTGRVAFVTGASRGIGKAIALRLAQHGADIVIAAKSEQSSELLPGSIHDAAREVEALGRRALAVKTDVRFEEQVQAAVEAAIARFGRIDILINNAGAIWTRPVLETPPKKFDLMMAVNVRASYLTAYFALPHMQLQRWGHILNMCPPLHTDPTPGRGPYMVSKLGMARIALAIAEEHRADNIAANTLWPRTIIESQASINWKMADRSQWRTPEIMCDAVCAIFSQEPARFSGHMLIDEQALESLAGVTNFDRYWCEGKPPARPIYIDKW